MYDLRQPEGIIAADRVRDKNNLYKTLTWFIDLSACDFEVNVETAIREQEREEVEPVSR